MYLADLYNPMALCSSFRDTPFYVVTCWPGHDFADASEAEVIETIIDPTDQEGTDQCPWERSPSTLQWSFIGVMVI